MLRDGAVVSGLGGALIIGALWYDADIFHDDYPPDVRAAAGPISARAKKERLVLIAPLVATVLSVPLVSTRRLTRDTRDKGGSLSVTGAFLHAYGVRLVFNVFDAVVVDYLLIMRLQPRFVILPGTEGLPGYADVSFHAKAFLKSLILTVPTRLLVAGLTRLPSPGRILHRCPASKEHYHED